MEILRSFLVVPLLTTPEINGSLDSTNLHSLDAQINLQRVDIHISNTLLLPFTCSLFKGHQCL